MGFGELDSRHPYSQYEGQQEFILEILILKKTVLNEK